MLIFVSYASPDRDRVMPLVNALLARGLDVWMDSLRLKPGQDWRFEIELAMDKAEIVLAFISKNSVDRRGFVQRELRNAIDKAQEKLAEDIFLVPVLLDADLDLHPSLKRLHYVSAFDHDALQRISDAIDYQAQRLGRSRSHVQETKGIRWTKHAITEKWEGFPGFSVAIQYHEFQSDSYPSIIQVTECIKGHYLLSLFEGRRNIIHQMPDLFSMDDVPFRRTNTYDAVCLEPNVIGHILSIQYRIHWYGAGAAHPNMHFETFNFVLEPLTRIDSLAGMCADPARAHLEVREIVRQKLYEICAQPDQDNMVLAQDWINRGTESPRDLNTFWFTPDGVEFLFAPYQIASYAHGPHTVLIPYSAVLPLLRPNIANHIGTA